MGCTVPYMSTNAQTRLHLSDLVWWKWNSDATVATLTLLAPHAVTDGDVTVIDRRDVYNTRGRFTCQLRYEGELASCSDRRWTVVTQGAQPGGRRYRCYLDLHEAQHVAMAWLDRRFRVEIAD